MKIFFDLFPVILFFIGFKFYGIFVATAIAITATLGLIVYSKIRHGKVDNMLMANGAIITVLGGITLMLHDQTFIMWKPTVLYWLGAAILLISKLFFNKNFIQQMLGSMLNPPAHIWTKLNYIWVVFLIILGLVNLYVAFNYSLDNWVNFKLFGVTSVLFTFIIVQMLVLKDYIIQPSDHNTKE